MKSVLFVVFFFFSLSVTAQHDHHNHDDHGQGDHHHHDTIEVSHLINAPKIIAIEVIKDSKKGYNLYFQTENFVFTPENVNRENVMGQGHAHLYINGKKITRLYGHWYYISSLAEGLNTIEVTLNANDHSDYVYSGQRVGAQSMIFN